MNEQTFPKISVIIPAYNSGQTIERAVRSALGQTYPNTEVIAIDDGSADDTADILKRLSENDERLKLIIKSNAGVSAARNDGIMAAEGEWFVTLDADDYIDSEMLMSLYDAAVRTEADTVICGFRKVYDDGRKESFRVDEDYTDERDAFLDNMLIELYDKHMISTHSNQLFNTAIVNRCRIYYNEMLAVNEDIDYVLRYLRHCRSIGVIRGVYLNYVQHGAGESLITTFHDYGIASSLLILKDCNALFEGMVSSNETIDEMNNRLFVHICSFVGLMYYMSGYSERRMKAEIRELCEKEEFFDLLEDMKPKGVKATAAYMLLKSGRYETYHRLCKRLYKKLKTDAGAVPDSDKSDEEIAVQCRRPYVKLGIYTNIYRPEAGGSSADKGMEREGGYSSEYISVNVDTETIMAALEKIAEDSAGQTGSRGEDENREQENTLNSTHVTMEDLIKIRELLQENR